MAESWRFELSIDELRAVCELVPELVLPSGYTASDLSPLPDDANEDTAIAAGHASLKERGLVGPQADGDPEGVAPALLFALSLHAVAERALRIFAWSPAEESRELISVNRGACAGLRRVQRRGALDPTARIVVTFMYLGELTKHLLELVADNSPGTNSPLTSTTIGLVDSRAVVEAVRAGNQEFLASLTSRSGDDQDVELMSGLTRQMDAGFHLELLDREARCLYMGDWFRGDDGWISMTVIPGQFPVSGESLAESGRMRLAKVSRSLIRADLLEMVAGLRRTRDVA
ncbi:hypothetical protein [Leifsonia tongyongensis]|uniref:hypothetical protein n=1 Tax=Leifsonia tongyongensis TaxID=1268043 RepID=UPI0019634549|nr:hypothetical protein [Diaminobutyricibacter tongyongensis]